MTQPYTIRDEPNGRVFDYSVPAVAPTPRGDNISHSYTPPNHDTARGWAFDDAMEACFTSAILGLVLGLASVAAAGKFFSVSLPGAFGVFGVVFALPFVWPITQGKLGWRNPIMAYRMTRWHWQNVVTEYHEAAIERLRPTAQDASSATATPTITRTAPDAGEIFYLQCAAVLERAIRTPRSPRNASEAIRRTFHNGVSVVVTKDDYDSVAGMLCELGFMVGGEGQKPRNYALAANWQDRTVKELWTALKGHRETIKARAG